ncbi:MAG: AAA family ATPase [Patescibacteria group bacterium]
MHLKSLELNGFKSFAAKTILEFPKGITAIVGPNGSGKSNVIDAIRWLLGERDAKNLRGEKIENLIFAGTSKRARSGMAQVSLNFDNNSGFFSTEFSEISVVRRVNRDGVSQYLLNKSELRLKDIVDFFAKSRLGTKGLTIINQGNSDLFVRANPEERRIMIEEVLGLREYQLKKSEAERRLNNTNINLEKVKAMIEEVLPRLRMLKRQTSKWEKRSQVENELKELENSYFSLKLKEINVSLKNFEPELKEIEENIYKKREELKNFENNARLIEKKSNNQELNIIKAKKNDLLNKHLNFQKELSRLEAKIEIFSKVDTSENSFDNGELIRLIKEIKESLEKGAELSDLKDIVESVKKVVLKISDFFGNFSGQKTEEVEDLEKVQMELLEKINLIGGEIKIIEREESETVFGLEEFNKNFQKAFEAIENKKNEIREFDGRKQRIIFEKEKLSLKNRDLEEQLMQIGRNINDFINLNITIDGEYNFFETERKMIRLRGELASMGEIDQALIKEAEEVEKHYNFLTTQIQDLEKALEDLKILIKELKDKINSEFLNAFHSINDKFNHFFKLMFKGGNAKMKIRKQEIKVKINEKEEDAVASEDENEEQEEKIGIEIELDLPKKRITSLEMLSGGEKSLVSIAALFALVSVSPPPFLVLDEIDAALDEKNSKMFADLIRDFSGQTQFIIVTHNRAVMETANILYGVTMNDDGTSKLLSLKLSETTS